MTEQELAQLVTSKGWVILSVDDKETIGDYTHRLAKIIKIDNNIIQRKSVSYYRRADGEVFWFKENPLPDPPAVSFNTRLSQYIATAIDTGAVKAVFVEKVNEPTALVVVVNTVNEYETKLLVEEDGTFSATTISGVYPIGGYNGVV